MSPRPTEGCLRVPGEVLAAAPRDTGGVKSGMGDKWKDTAVQPQGGHTSGSDQLVGSAEYRTEERLRSDRSRFGQAEVEQEPI